MCACRSVGKQDLIGVMRDAAGLPHLASSSKPPAEDTSHELTGEFLLNGLADCHNCTKVVMLACTIRNLHASKDPDTLTCMHRSFAH